MEPAPQPKPPSLKRNALLFAAGAGILLCIVIIVVTSLGSRASGSPTPDAQAIYTSAYLTVIAQLPKATSTPANTPTAEPTDTPPPTPTPLPEPIMLSGSGDSVVDVEKWDGPAIAKISYNGGSNFAIWNDDASGEHIDLLVNTIGSYEGTLPVDFMQDELTTRFEVTAAGPWQIQLLPLQQVRVEQVPGTISGNGDEVFAIRATSGQPDLLKADASHASHNFVVYAYADKRDLLVNEIAPYSGTVVVGRDTVVIAVEATGPWSLEITTK